MVLATYNAAGIRARMNGLCEWLETNEPDVLAIQETKVEDAKFPLEEIENLGYHVAFNGQKSFNGVAILSKSPLLNVRNGFLDDLWQEDARIIAAEVDGLTIINTYVPNGTAVGTDKFVYKLRWLERFRAYLDERYRAEEPVVWLGDVNIAPTADDVFSLERHRGRVGFHPDEISRLERIVDWGFADLFRLEHQGPGHYTYWEFTIPKSVERNLGWRIDHIYGTAPVVQACERCWIDKDAREMERPSDHTFVLAELDL